jgi:hypothetical protein
MGNWVKRPATLVTAARPARFVVLQRIVSSHVRRVGSGGGGASSSRSVVIGTMAWTSCEDGQVVAPRTQFVRVGGVSIGYQTFGQGPDLLVVPGGPSHLELRWHLPLSASFHRSLA